MTDFFLELVNISITASYIIAAVILFRAVLKKIPRKFICALWAIAGIRLVFPFSIESALSLIPSAKTIDPVSGAGYGITVNSGIPAVDRPVNDFLVSTEMASTNALTYDIKDIIVSAVSIVWIVGIIAILLYGIISYIKVKKSVKTAVLLKDNVWQSESVVSPFILGVFKPKIYIPFNMDGETRNYVVAHENAHLRRRDHWIKPLGFLILAVYWFNPLVWIAYVLLCRDIEAACDEKVIAHMDGDTRKEYASALLECAVNRRRIAACPLAFGEVSVKNRIKNIMSYKKPAFRVIILAVVACIAAAVCFLTNPETTEYYDCGYVLRVTLGETEGGYYRLNNRVSGKLHGDETFEITEVDLQSGSVEIEFSEKVLESIEKNFYDDLLSGKEKTKTLKLDFGEKKTVFYSDDNEDKVTFTVEKKQSLDDAITAAIMERSADKYTKGDYACEFHEILSTEAGGDADSNDIEVVTAFINSAYGEYINKNGVAECIGGYSMPLALTFRVEDTGYSLVEYWMPEDGNRYADSIREKFPVSAAEMVISDTGYAAKQCQAIAQDYFNQNSNVVSGYSYHYVGKTKAYTTSDEVEIFVAEVELGAKIPYIALNWHNGSSVNMREDDEYELYRFENNEWVKCELLIKDWTLGTGELMAGSSVTRKYSIGSRFDISKNGYYRLTDNFSLNGEIHTAAAEFVIDINDGREKLELPAGESMLVPDSLYTVYSDNVSSKRSDSWEIFERRGFLYALIEYSEPVEPISCVIIKSKEDLEKFLVEMTPYFDMSPSDKGTTFLDRTKTFDEEFFKENSLMIMYVKENSYSITHTLSDIYLHHQKPPEESRSESDGYALSFNVHRNIPDGELADAATELFITVAMDNAAIGDVGSCYVTYGEDINENREIYRYNADSDNSFVYAYINLYNDTEMEFMYSMLSSYWPHGTYTLDEEKLVMKTDDGRYTYTFRIDGENFVFDAAHSSELPEYNYGNGKKFKPVPDGAVFVKD